ncbi:acetolactate synthase III large subunit domain protein [Flagelloscypha sp. PMI_526]|nr:acetolactate synthase III large subunit domain protein [Flagelloscypha sp. PMI_526]
MLDMHGSPYANFAMQEADVIVALGARFDDRIAGTIDTFAPAARQAALEGRGGIIHFEIMPKNMNKVVQASVPILGDFNKINQWKKDYPFTYVPSKVPTSPTATVETSPPSKTEQPTISTTSSVTVEAISPSQTESPSCSLETGVTEEMAEEVMKEGFKMKPQEVISCLDKLTTENGKKSETIITTGVGQHQMWAAQFYRWTHPRTMVTSGGLGTMGFGLPAAIGAKVAAPQKTVIDIDGDASFSMTAMELATASQYNIGVKILVLNNEFQWMVLQWQDLFYENRYSHTAMTNPDFVKLAEAMGVKGIRVRHKGELEEKMKEFLEYNGARPVLMECLVEKNEHVFPMVPAGKALHEQMLHPSLTKK